jgi:hypothetical protein
MQRRYYILFALIVLVYFTGMLCDVMAVDAAQYAEMSLEMLRTHSFLKIHALGADRQFFVQTAISAFCDPGDLFYL